MPLILGAQSAVATGFAVDNSCRFNDGDTATLEKALGTPTSEKIFTWSAWFKRGVLTGDQSLFSCGSGGDTERFDFRLNSGGEFYCNIDLASNYRWQTTQLLQDVAAWYHLVVMFDTSQAVDTNRFKFYINGTEIAKSVLAVTAYPAQDYVITAMASGQNVSIGKRQYGSSLNLDAYIAEVCYCDGQIYAASDFGEFDEDSPTIWKPKDVSGLTFGNNGFYLDFEDSANLGNDANGGTDLTESNLTASDQATDTPSNNFCTMNPLDNYYGGATFSEGNAKVVTGSGVYAPAFGTVGLTAGKWYWEVILTAVGATAAGALIGVASDQTTAAAKELGDLANDYGFYGQDGKIRNNDAYHTYGAAYAVDDVIGVALDITNNKLYFAKDNVWENSGVPTSGATGTGAFSITMGALDRWVASCSYWDSGTGTYEFNFGGCPAFTVSSGNADGNGYGNFEYEPPSGYLAICTKNLGSDGG